MRPMSSLDTPHEKCHSVQMSAGGVAKRSGLKCNRSSSDSLRASPLGDDAASQRTGGSESDALPAAKPKPKRPSSGTRQFLGYHAHAVHAHDVLDGVHSGQDYVKNVKSLHAVRNSFDYQALRRVTLLCRRAAAAAHDVQLLQDARHAPVALRPRRAPHPVQCVSAPVHLCSWCIPDAQSK